MRTEKAKKVPGPREARGKFPGLSQEKLAQRIGCSTATVVRSERLGQYPKVETLKRAYLAALGLTEVSK